MTWLRKARFFSATVVAVAVLAWITGTNHCLLGLIQRGQNAADSMSHCSGHSKGSDATHPGPCGMLACCQGLLSPHFELAKGNVPFFPGLMAFQFFVVSHLTL